jgi:LPXTG-motif cell wall-anchored protein
VERWSVRAALVAVGVVAGWTLFSAAPAVADTTVNINPGNVPTSAAKVANHQCSSDQGGGPFAGLDVWVFILPGNHASSGDFVTLTATFDTDGNGIGDTTLTLPSANGGFLNGGPATSKAFLRTTAGWTLTAASATVTGSADFFTLSHTCPASSGPTPTPSPSGTPTSPGGTPTPTGSSSSGGGTPSSSGPGGGTSSSGGSGGGTSSSSGGGGGSLPITGAALALPIAFGVALIVGGTLLVLARRRSDRSTQL